MASAQTAYDRIAWQTNAGTSSEAADLQDATIDYEKAKAAYEESTAPASDADLQNAYSSVQSAQQDLDTLLSQPTAADVASAEADVMDAQATLSDLLAGADAKSLEDARLDLSRAQLTVESAAADLAASQLRAPSDGTVLEVSVVEGDQASEGTVAVVLADVGQLQLTVNVAEVDVDKVSIGMPAQVTVDALPGKSFDGEVTRIAPSTDPDSSVVNYPVTVRLTDDSLGGARAGMTAVATLSTAEAKRWLARARQRHPNPGRRQPGHGDAERHADAGDGDGGHDGRRLGRRGVERTGRRRSGGRQCDVADQPGGRARVLWSCGWRSAGRRCARWHPQWWDALERRRTIAFILNQRVVS